MSQSPQVDKSPQKGQQKKAWPWILAVAAILVVPPLVVVVGSALSRLSPSGDEIPVLERPRYEEAKARWRERGLQNYDMDVVFAGGSDLVKNHVEVRKGRLTKFTRNGVEPATRAEVDTWSVDHQFRMIEKDLDLMEDPDREFTERQHVKVLLRAEFDPEYGYPKVYKFDAKGSPRNSNWVVERFEVVDDDS